MCEAFAQILDDSDDEKEGEATPLEEFTDMDVGLDEFDLPGSKYRTADPEILSPDADADSQQSNGPSTAGMKSPRGPDTESSTDEELKASRIAIKDSRWSPATSKGTGRGNGTHRPMFEQPCGSFSPFEADAPRASGHGQSSNLPPNTFERVPDDHIQHTYNTHNKHNT